jgi:hypothetical protein
VRCPRAMTMFSAHLCTITVSDRARTIPSTSWEALRPRVMAVLIFESSADGVILATCGRGEG